MYYYTTNSTILNLICQFFWKNKLSKIINVDVNVVRAGSVVNEYLIN